MTFLMRVRRFLPLTLCLVAVAPSAFSQTKGVCSNFYSSGFTLAQGKVNPAIPALAKPAKGAVIREPNFGTCLFRATDHAKEDPVNFARTDYSRRQSFNADNTYFIVNASDGWWHLYDANTLQYLRKLSPKVPAPATAAEFHLAGDAEPQWHPTDPNILYYLPNNGGTKLLQLDVRTNIHKIAADFAGKLPSWGASASHIWTKSEGSPSADARYWGFQVENSSFGLLGYMTWDLQNNRLIGSYPSSSRPDHSSMSASGRWYVTSDDVTGTWAWSPDFSQKKKLHNKSEHSDLAYGPNKEDYYVSVDYQSAAGDVFFTNIDTCPAVAASATTAPVCPRTVLFPSYANGAATAMHFSGKAFSRPGWVLFSTYGSSASRDGTWPWFTNKIYAVELKANPLVYAIATTRRNEGITSYTSEPHATASRDFTRIAFNSNWGGGGEDIDTYMVQLPSNALPGGIAPLPSSRVTGGYLPPIQGSSATSAASKPVQGSAPVSTTTGSEAPAAAPVDTVWTPPAHKALRSMLSSIRHLSASNPLAMRVAFWSVPGASWWLKELSMDQPSKSKAAR